MKKLLYFAGFMAILVVLHSCQQEEKKDPFQINKNSVGLLTSTTPIKALDSIFAKDSIVNKDKGFSRGSDIMVYDKNGKELLLLDPVQNFDSTSTIANVRIKDERFATDKGLTINSTFKDISKHYKIARIENTLRSAVIFLDEINAYVTIDKEVISGSAKYNTDVKIEPSQIPDDAKIKQFWLGWK
ncbi:hypothetical protein [Haloflavibacter putidus]|uniref:Uncharacterized protein n=1 Tax=Haloflavibacter putidus TaxID=2576776 RepID=A0A507ZG68_9FLAO|nr:hypothetical protein [Haloflavibacter putidus]TQD34878.1 hypothetical protein FKR84_11830 [Haloflavibacter putidus]